MNNNDEFRYDRVHQEKLMKKFKSGPEWTRLKLWMIVCFASAGWMVAIALALWRK